MRRRPPPVAARGDAREVRPQVLRLAPGATGGRLNRTATPGRGGLEGLSPDVVAAGGVSGAARRTLGSVRARLAPAALLAPVPHDHLLDGADVCANRGKVAFGSRAWEVIRRLDDEAAPGAAVALPHILSARSCNGLLLTD